jgi:hypothetical protein
LYTKPEASKNSSADDREVAEVVSETCSRGDGKGDVKICSNGSVENSRDGIADTSKKDYKYGICSGKTCIKWSEPYMTTELYYPHVPIVRMEEPVLQVAIVTKSENQYVMKADFPQVRFSAGTGSISGFVHT